MLKSLCPFFLISLFLLPSLVKTQVGSIIQADFIPIQYKSNEISIDGNTDDWSLDQVYTFSVAHHIGSSIDSITTIQKPDSIAVALTWDEYFLYLLLQSNDQNLNKIEDSITNPKLWHNDGLELYIDPKMDSPERMNINDFNCVVDFMGEYVFFTPTKRTIEDAYYNVPKEANAVDIYFESAAQHSGTVNDNSDVDEGYFIEVKIPWAALGILPQREDLLRLEVCANDLDTLCQKNDFKFDSIQPSLFYFGSWTASTNWGIPKNWKTVKLIGQAPLLSKLSQKYPNQILFFFATILLVLSSLILFLMKKYNKLKDVYQKSTIKNKELIQLLQGEKLMVNDQTIKGFQLFEEAQNILNQHLSENIRPVELAQELGLSLRQFQRLCKEKLNTTPSSLITMYKIEKAAYLLKNEQMNISEVAYAVGFSDPNYFSKVFKKYFGQSPRAYLSN